MYRSMLRSMLLVPVAGLALAWANEARADAQAVNVGIFRFIKTGAAAAGAPACNFSAFNFTGTTIQNTCFSAAAGNVAYAYARSGPGTSTKTVQFTRGTATTGATRFGVAALGDTASLDSFVVTKATTGANQVTLTIAGETQRQTGSGFDGPAAFTLMLYPDRATAVADSNAVGTGALFQGVLTTYDSGPITSGGFSPSDFAVTTGGGRIRVQANALNKVINGVAVPDSAAFRVKVHSSTSVPGHNPLVLSLMALLMGGLGIVAIRRRAGTSRA